MEEGVNTVDGLIHNFQQIFINVRYISSNDLWAKKFYKLEKQQTKLLENNIWWEWGKINLRVNLLSRILESMPYFVHNKLIKPMFY